MPKGKNTVEIKRPVTLPNGETKRRSFYGQTLEEAEASWRAAANPALESPDLRAGTFSWWLVVRYKPLKDHLEANTLGNYQFAISHLVPEIGHLRVDTINATVLASALSRIAAKETPRSRKVLFKPDGSREIVHGAHKKLAASSVNRCRMVALEVMAIAAEEGAAKPINSRRVPKRDEPALEIDPYDPREMRALWLRCKSSIADLPVFLMCFLGLTVNEALAIDKSNLTPQGVLSVTFQMKRTGERSKKMKNQYRTRHIPLPPAMAEQVRHFFFGDGPACVNTKGERVDEQPLSTSVYSKMRLAGLRRLTLHQLRHSFSSWLEENGCPRAVRLRLMGQSRKGVADRYNHSSEGAMRDWLGRLWEASLLPFDEGTAPREILPNIGGTKTPSVGASNGRSRLNDEKVREIRGRLAKETDYAIARDYGVDPKAIRQIRQNLTWQHVA